MANVLLNLQNFRKSIYHLFKVKFPFLWNKMVPQLKKMVKSANIYELTLTNILISTYVPNRMILWF